MSKGEGILAKICIDKYEKGVPEGRIYPVGCEGFTTGFCFHGTIAFLKSIEFLLRQNDQANLEDLRVFGEQTDNNVQPQQMVPGYGRTSTFVIRILYRQHNNWQGTIRWCEGEQEACFRSEMELLLLMDSAMQEGKNARYVSAKGKKTR